MIHRTAGKLILMASLISTVYGQTTTNPRTTSTDDEFQQQSREQFLREINRTGQYSPSFTNTLSPQNPKVLKAIAEFASALAEYRTAVTAGAQWEKPLKVMEQLAQDLDGATRAPNTPGFDKAPYAKLSRDQLAAATLKFAESLNADLLGLSRIAENRFLLLQPDAQKYMSEIHGQVLQLRFLISKTQSAKK